MYLKDTGLGYLKFHISPWKWFEEVFIVTEKNQVLRSRHFSNSLGGHMQMSYSKEQNLGHRPQCHLVTAQPFGCWHLGFC